MQFNSNLPIPKTSIGPIENELLGLVLRFGIWQTGYAGPSAKYGPSGKRANRARSELRPNGNPSNRLSQFSPWLSNCIFDAG